MQADVILSDNTLELNGDMVVATSDAHEFTSKGAFSGFAFHDRADPANRFVLYAHQNKVRIWRDGIHMDILSIDEDKGIDVFKIAAGSIKSIAVSCTNLTVGNSILTESIHADLLMVKRITGNSVVIRYKEMVPGDISQNGQPSPDHEIDREMNLLKTIQEMQKNIDELQIRLSKLDGKSLPNGRPQPVQ